MPVAFILGLLGAFAMAACQWLIFVYAPIEASMGVVQKIFYVHLPLAWWAFVSFFVVFVSSILYIRSRSPRWDHMAAAAAEIGLLCAALALVTGSIWARHSWGVWWTWDPRLTTTLVLCFVYAGYLVLRTMDMPQGRRSMVCAVVGIVAFMDVPLVFISARLWRSIHPAVFASQGGGLDESMYMTVMACLAAFGLLWAAMFIVRLRQYDMHARLHNLEIHNRMTGESL